jgi:hypothetical protein
MLIRRRKMRKSKVLLLALLLGCVMVGGAFADDDDKLTVQLDDGTVQFVIDENGEMGYKALNELVTTNDTLTAAESGKIFIIDPASTPVTLTLPTAAAGLVYEFASAENIVFNIDPQSTDTIKYASDSATLMSAGDKLASPGATGDSVKFVAVGTLTWYVKDIATPDSVTPFVDAN